MNIYPERRKRHDVPVRTARHEMGQWLNEVFQEFDRTFGHFDEPMSSFLPQVDVKENEKEVVVTAELPGIDEKDVAITIANNVLHIKGEKRAETEEKGKDYYRMERSYGEFHRAIPLPVEVNEGKVNAKFKKGVLTIALPKSKEARATTKRIPVHTG